MPLKRTPRVLRETARSRALRGAVAEEFTAMLARMPADGRSNAKRKRDDVKAARQVARVFAKAFEKWDAATPAWRERQGRKILAFLRRYDRSATLAADGGRALYAVSKLTKPVPTAPAGDGYVAHRAAAVRPAPAPKEGAKAVEPAGVRKVRRRRPVGRVGYIDPRLIDDDDWDE